MRQRSCVFKNKFYTCIPCTSCVLKVNKQRISILDLAYLRNQFVIIRQIAYQTFLNGKYDAVQCAAKTGRHVLQGERKLGEKHGSQPKDAV